MADNKEPVGLDDFLAEQDPQSAVAAQGLQQGAEALYNSEPVQNVITGTPIVNTYSNALAAAQGDPDAQQAIADSSLGMAMGTLKAEPKSFGTVANNIKQSGVITDSKGVQTQVVNGKPNYGKVIVKMAEGGEVPAGLDEFISGSNEQPMVDNSAINQTNFTNPTQSSSPSINSNSVPPAGLDEFIAPQIKEDKYGTPLEMGKTALEGAAQGLIGPLAPLAERIAGVSAKDIRSRAETNPKAHGLAEIGGLTAGLLTGTGEGKLLSKAGELIGEAEGAGLAGRIGNAVAKGALENAIFQSGDEISKMIVNDPQTSLQTAIPEIGLAALLGAGVNGSMLAISPLWKYASGNKLGQTAADFADKINFHLNNPDPAESVVKELGDYYGNIKSYASEVYGPEGIKAQEISKVVPEMSDAIADQAANTLSRVNESVSKLSDDPHVKLLQGAAEKYGKALETNEPGEIFNATQDLKQQLQEWSKYNKDISPLAERKFRNEAKDLAYEIRGSLEDTSVWGKAAERQKEINKAFNQYLPTLKDFESKFTVKVGGEPELSPEKIKTYLNQVGKENAATRQKMLKNFRDKSEAYKEVIASSHHNLGLESPVVHSPLNATMASLKESTTGGKLADAFIKQGLSEGGAKATGAAIGAAIGHPFGAGAIGALVGTHVFGPFIKSVLPAIVKPMLKTTAKGVGLKAAAEYGAAVAKGDEMLTKGARSVFKSDMAPLGKQASDAEIKKLDKRLQELREDPTPLENTSGDVGHYLPEHAGAAGATAAAAVTYLNSLRPDRTKQSPLDMAPEPSKAAKAAYTSALRVAEQPLSVFDSLKNGTLTPQDVKTLGVLYPQLYNSMKSKLIDQLTTSVSKGQNVPYRVRMGVSMFTGVPLDSTMLPQSIQSAQMSMQRPMQQQTQGGVPNKTKRGTAPLSKIGEQNRTPAQAAEADQAKR